MSLHWFCTWPCQSFRHHHHCSIITWNLCWRLCLFLTRSCRRSTLLLSSGRTMQSWLRGDCWVVSRHPFLLAHDFFYHRRPPQSIRVCHKLSQKFHPTSSWCNSNGYTLTVWHSHRFHRAICWCQWLSRPDLAKGSLSKPHRQYRLVVVYYAPQPCCGSLLPFIQHQQTGNWTHEGSSVCSSLHPIYSWLWHLVHVWRCHPYALLHSLSSSHGCQSLQRCSSPYLGPIGHYLGIQWRLLGLTTRQLCCWWYVAPDFQML